jgi:ATP-dependent Clp protease ATP-binding subunit ClpB
MKELNQESNRILGVAQTQKDKLKHTELHSLHLWNALLFENEKHLKSVLQQLKISLPEIKKSSQEVLKKLPQLMGKEVLNESISPDLNRILRGAQLVADELVQQSVQPLTLLISLVRNTADRNLIELLQRYQIQESYILEAVKMLRNEDEDENDPLKLYGLDLTEKAEKGELEPVIGREDEIRRSIQILSRKTKNNPVLIGEPGVGKTAIAEGLAQRIKIHAFLRLI